MKDFDKLVAEAARDIHSGLLEGGGKKMRDRVFVWFNHVLQLQRSEKPILRKRVSAVRLAEMIRDEIMRDSNGVKGAALTLCDRKKRILRGYTRTYLCELIQAQIEKAGVCE